MGKLIKYEFRKQLMSKIVVGALVLITQLLLAAGLIFDNGDWAGFGMGGLGVLTVMALFYFSFESIITYSHDLKTKQSYMLFLTPRNMYQIVGAKMITTVLQIFVAGAAFIAIFIGDALIVCAVKGNIKELIEVLTEFFKAFTGVKIRLVEVIYVLLMVLVAWLEFILMAMFAITLSTTLFANKKYKGVVSVVIYFVTEWLVGKVAGFVVSTGFLEGEYLVVNTEAWAFIGVYVTVMVLCFFGTSLLLEKKVSV